MVNGMMTNELVAVLQDRDSCDEIRTKQFFNYLNIIPSSNNHILMKYWNSCFTEFSKFKYVH